MQTTPCVPCCSTPQTTNIPGPEGSNAWTITTANFSVPAKSFSTTIFVMDSQWMAIGETIFIQGAGYFTVTNLPTQQSAVVQYQNIAANTAAGNTITSPATVTPSAVANNGTDGQSAFTVTTANFTVPNKGSPVAPPGIVVANSDWAAIGQNIFVQGAGYFTVTGKADSLHISATYNNIAANTAAGNVINSTAEVSPAGPSQLTGALPTSLTDNSTGAQSNTIAAGAGVSTIAFYIEAATIAAGDLLTTYIPGYKFKLLKFDARCAKPVTTGGKAATVSLKITGVAVTGGAIALAGTYILGAAQNGSTITATNTGANTDSITISAAAVTPFTEGAFWLIIEIQNMDSADAIASLSKHVNDIITALS